VKSSELHYLATPYSKLDITSAWIDACQIAGRLMRAGVHLFSPIAHSHPIAAYSGIDPLNHEFWLPICDVMMSRCDVLIVAHMDGWVGSVGIRHEIEFFEKARKPIFDLPNIATCRLVLRPEYAFADHQRERVT
jgi:hypothetical protein